MGHSDSMRTSAWAVLSAVAAVCVAICAADLAVTNDEPAFLQLQTGMGTVRGHCEICIAVMQAKERGEPHLCASFRHPTYYTTCVEVITSLLRADRALVYWIENGCIHNDPSQGPELVKPCPAAIGNAVFIESQQATR